MANRATSQPSSFAAPESERRTQARHPFPREAPFRLGNDIGTATVRDLSPGGIGLLIPCSVAPGETIAVELPEQSEDTWLLKRVQVVHATLKGPGHWLVGGVFVNRLNSKELRVLLGDQPGR